MENSFNLKYDIVIVGGGTSGCAAAYNSAKLGFKTLLVEKNNFLGGLMTAGLVVPVMKSSLDETNSDYYKVLVSKMKEYNAQITYFDNNDGWFNPEILKIALDDILFSSEISKNLDILFETTVDKVFTKDGVIENIILNSNLLSIPIDAMYYIDATGSAEFSIKAGCELLKDTSIKQQNTLRFVLSNVNIEQFCDFITSIDKDRNITNTYRNDVNTRNELHFTTASTWDENKTWAVDSLLKKGVEDGILKEDDRSYFQIFSIAGSTNEVAFNCPRINNFIDNPFKYSLELINARKAIYRLYRFVKKYFKGFEDSTIVNIATQTGIREQNRVKTKYIYKKEDLISSKKFENPVLKANYPIDIHSKDKNGSILQKNVSYELPLESLISYNFQNLFVIGKIIGAEFEAHSALRVQKSCMSMGEAIVKYIKKNY